MYKQTHTSTVVQEGRGGVLDTPCDFIDKSLPLVDSLWRARQGEVHIMGCWGPCDLIQDLGNRNVLDARRRVRYDIIKQLAAVCRHFVLYFRERRKTTDDIAT